MWQSVRYAPLNEVCLSVADAINYEVDAHQHPPFSLRFNNANKSHAPDIAQQATPGESINYQRLLQLYLPVYAQQVGYKGQTDVPCDTDCEWMKSTLLHMWLDIVNSSAFSDLLPSPPLPSPRIGLYFLSFLNTVLYSTLFANLLDWTRLALLSRYHIICSQTPAAPVAAFVLITHSLAFGYGLCVWRKQCAVEFNKKLSCHGETP